MLYNSINNPKIKDLKKLETKKYRNKTNLFLVEGSHLVEEAYKSGYLKELLLLEDYNYQLDIKTNYISKNVMDYLSNLETPSKMIGICQKKENKIKGNHILMLDNIQDPGNLGTIIRSAVAFNVDSIILENCVDVYSDKVLRASQGMIFKINIVFADIKETISMLKQNNYLIMGTKVTKAKELKTIPKPQKYAIIMGNEGNGVREEILNLCDENIYIKMNETCESLNVAVATSIILYWVGD